MAREAMKPLIDYIRQYGSASEDEIIVNGVQYWTDDQLVAIIDKRAYWATFAVDEATTGVYVPRNLRHYYADPDTISLLGSSDTELDAVFVYDPMRAEITTTATPYYIRAKFTNGYEALSDLWELKANMRYDYIAIKGGQNRMELEQEYKHCVERMMYYRNRIIRRHARGGGRWVR